MDLILLENIFFIAIVTERNIFTAETSCVNRKFVYSKAREVFRTAPAAYGLHC
jgi:hypothetical protein